MKYIHLQRELQSKSKKDTRGGTCPCTTLGDLEPRPPRLKTNTQDSIVARHLQFWHPATHGTSERRMSLSDKHLISLGRRATKQIYEQGKTHTKTLVRKLLMTFRTQRSKAFLVNCFHYCANKQYISVYYYTCPRTLTPCPKPVAVPESQPFLCCSFACSQRD